MTPRGADRYYSGLVALLLAALLRAVKALQGVITIFQKIVGSPGSTWAYVSFGGYLASWLGSLLSPTSRLLAGPSAPPD